jgi:predicted TIM-barrel fold metal-dependent hydrolase
VKRFTEPHHLASLLTLAHDIHQHLWPESLVRALSDRREPPMLLRGRDGWRLRLRGEPEAPVDLGDHDPGRRAALAEADGLDRVLVAPSTPLGIEALRAAEAEPLLEAYHEGVGALPEPFGAWAAVGLAAPDAAALSRRIDEGFAGACVAAEALGGPAGYDRLGPVLETLERRDAPLLIHPGSVALPAPHGAPPWWGALTDYVSSMHAAWHAFAVWGRPAHPGLRVCFAMLAGLAPLHRERLLARGGRLSQDPGVFLDVSSYGERAVDMVVREIGVDPLVFGSDRPVVEARELALGDAVDAALRERNPARLLGAVPAQVPA